jgi:Putative peptidoglycan binding domain
MKTQKSFRNDSNRRLLSMVPVISLMAFARPLEEKASKRLPRIKMQSVSLSMLTALATFVTAPGLMSQTMLHIAAAPVARVQVPSIHLNRPPQLRTSSSNFRIAGFPSGPTQLLHPQVFTPASDAWARINGRAAYNPNLIPILGMAGLPTGPSQAPYPVPRTLANDALVRSNAWAAYNASVHPNTGLQAAETPAAAENPNRLASRQNSLDPNRFIQMPQSAGRYNFQFSDHEIRSVQGALRRLGIYSGQVDGILGPDTRRAVEDYQVDNKLPVTGQPDQRLNALLGIF